MQKMLENIGRVGYIIIIILIIGVAFLSQQPYSRGYWQNAVNWVGGEASNGGAAGINQQQKNIFGNYFEKIKNYFSDMFSSVFHKNSAAPATTEPAQTSTSLTQTFLKQ